MAAQTETTVTVYISTEDDSQAVYAEGDMETMYDEMLDDVYGTVSIAGSDYDTSRALKELDPIAYRCGFADYVGSGEWAELEMPWSLYALDSSDEPVTDWIAANV